MHRETFLDAAHSHGVDPDAAAALYADLYEVEVERLSRDPAAFRDRSGLSRTVHVLIWLGTVGLIGAHAWWSTDGYESLGVGVVLALTLLWQAGFLGAAEWARRRGYGTLEAAFAATVAFYTRLAAYSVERLAGVGFHWHDFDDFYPYVSGGWVFVELASIAVAALLLRRYRRPFVTAPLALFTAFLAIDGATRALGGWDRRAAVEQVLLGCGVVAVAAGAALDYRGWRRFAFWPHLAGIGLVQCGLDFLCGDRYGLALFVTAAVALTLGVWLARVGYLVAGGAFAWAALGLSAHGAAFPFVLIAGSLCFIACAIWLARVDSPVRRSLAARGLPAPQRDLAY